MWDEFMKDYDMAIDEIDKDIIKLGVFSLASSMRYISKAEFADVKKAINHLLFEYKRVREENKKIKSKLDGRSNT